MGEYTRVCGEDGFKMADGTHKITKYDMTFVFWMVIDCLLKSKFVDYTANFTYFWPNRPPPRTSQRSSTAFLAKKKKHLFSDETLHA